MCSLLLEANESTCTTEVIGIGSTMKESIVTRTKVFGKDKIIMYQILFGI